MTLRASPGARGALAPRRPPDRPPADDDRPPFDPSCIVDTREQTPLPIAGPCERGTLTSRDYSYRGGAQLLSIERKSLADLISSLTTDRARFTRGWERLRGYPFARLLIVRDLRDLEVGAPRSNGNPLAMWTLWPRSRPATCPSSGPQRPRTAPLWSNAGPVGTVERSFERLSTLPREAWSSQHEPPSTIATPWNLCAR
jgi:hypothetical protein